MVGLNSWIVFLVLVLPSVKMYAIAQFPIVDNVFDIVGVLSCIFLMLLCLLKRNNLIVPRGCKYIFAFLCIFLISTIFHYGEDILGLISETSKILIVVLYLVLSLSSGERSFLKALRKFRTIYLIILFADSLCLLIETVGFKIYDSDIYTILGMDNYAAFSIVPMLSVVFYTSYKINGKIQVIDKIAFLSCFLAKFATVSLTAIISMAIMAAVICISINGKRLRKIISPKFIICMIVILIIGIVYFKMGQRIDALFLSTGKTITNRTMIWDHTIKSVSESPIIGFGYTNEDQFKRITGFFHVAWESTQTHPHNYILAILFHTGVVGLLIYIGIFNQFVKVIKNNVQNKITAIVLGGISGFLVLSIPDGYELLPSIYVFFSVVYLDSVKLSKRYMIGGNLNDKVKEG